MPLAPPASAQCLLEIPSQWTDSVRFLLVLALGWALGAFRAWVSHFVVAQVAHAARAWERARFLKRHGIGAR